MITSELKAALKGGRFDQRLTYIYGAAALEAQKARYCAAVETFEGLYGADREAALYSVAGRSELSGNHTDHNHGRVIAASIDLDIIAVASPNPDGVIRIKSEGFPEDTVDLNQFTAPDPARYGRSDALIAGMADGFRRDGHAVGGFDAYTTSNVLKGSGLSSSAAFENLVGTILSHLFNEGKVSPVEIAKISQYSEVHYFGKACGLMDQMVSSVGGFVAIDFGDTENPVIDKIDFDFADCGYALCIVDTKGNHSDLTPDYVAIPTEMKEVARFFGKEVLRQVDEKEFFEKIPEIRKVTSDRAILRAIHFFNDNRTAQEEAKALKDNDFETFKSLVAASGNSSFKYLQNIYSNSNPMEQGVALGLAVSEQVLKGKGGRVHGGGFAGTIQNFVPAEMVDTYKKTMEGVFGPGSCYVLNIRPLGGVQVTE